MTKLSILVSYVAGDRLFGGLLGVSVEFIEEFLGVLDEVDQLFEVSSFKRFKAPAGYVGEEEEVLAAGQGAFPCFWTSSLSFRTSPRSISR